MKSLAEKQIPGVIVAALLVDGEEFPDASLFGQPVRTRAGCSRSFTSGCAQAPYTVSLIPDESSGADDSKGVSATSGASQVHAHCDRDRRAVSTRLQGVLSASS